MARISSHDHACDTQPVKLQYSIYNFLYRHGPEKLVLFALKRLPLEGRSFDLVLRFYCLTRRLQTSPEEIKVIMPYAKQADSMLVFGLGWDTRMWIAFGPGDIVFIEDNPEWARNNSRFSEQTVVVRYGTRRQDYLDLLDKEDRLRLDLPEKVLNRRWDVIFVDAPNGYEDHHPGRMKSIYMASRLVNSGGFVIVHDLDRPVEQIYARKFLGTRIQSCQRLGVFRAP